VGLLDLVAKDQVKIFGNVKDFGELIEYRDELMNTAVLSAFIDRENTEPRTPAGYGAPMSRATLTIWIAQGEEGRKKIKVGVDRVSLYWRRGDAAKTELVVTAVLPDSDGAWHLECTK
jgi:hypothetical protein